MKQQHKMTTTTDTICSFIRITTTPTDTRNLLPQHPKTTTAIRKQRQQQRHSHIIRMFSNYYPMPSTIDSLKIKELATTVNYDKVTTTTNLGTPCIQQHQKTR